MKYGMSLVSLLSDTSGNPEQINVGTGDHMRVENLIPRMIYQTRLGSELKRKTA